MQLIHRLTLTVAVLLDHLAKAKEERDAYSDAMHEIVSCHQRLLGVAYLARLNGAMLDPEELIAHLTGRDTPHVHRTTN